MKRILTLLYITVLVTVFAACTKEIDFHRNDIKPQLLMNAQMTVGDTLHLVYLAISKDLSIDRIKSGTVKCYINGNLAAEGSLDDRDDELFVTDEKVSAYPQKKAGEAKQTRYSFKADFKPGDVVRIEAEADGGTYKAFSEVTVPQAPSFNITDTLYQKNPAYPDSFNEGDYRIRLKGKDISEKNDYYRIKAGYSRIDRFFKEATESEDAREWTAENEFKYIPLDKGNDPILNDGAPSEDIDLAGASENSFRVFSDKMFSGGSFNIGFTIESYMANNGPSTSEAFDKADSETTLSVILCGITEDEYYYLKALSIYNYLDGDTTITEPVSFPNNVEGGVGLVSICTPAEATVKFHRTFSGGGGIIWTD